MQEKESVMVVQFKLKIPSLGIMVRHHEPCFMKPNGFPRDRIFSLHLTPVKDSFSLIPGGIRQLLWSNLTSFLDVF